jgi:hypothetical protein
MTLILPRRRFLAGLVGIIAAPAIVRADNIMKVASAPIASDTVFVSEYRDAFIRAFEERQLHLLQWVSSVERDGVFFLVKAS